MLSTALATAKTFQISQREFPNIHGKHNKANAFRHALWNMIIAKKCTRFSKNIEAVLNWTEEITNWHEDFSPNEALPRMMDLHNNRIGRELFATHKNASLQEMTTMLIKQLDQAVRVTELSAFTNHPNQLTYLDD